MTILTSTITGKVLGPTLKPLKVHVKITAVAQDGILRNITDGSLIASEYTAETDVYGNLTMTLPRLPQAAIEPVEARWLLSFGSGLKSAKPLPKEFYLTGDTTWGALVDVSGIPATSDALDKMIAADSLHVWGHSYMWGNFSTGVTPGTNDAATIAAERVGLPLRNEAISGAQIHNVSTQGCWSTVLKKGAPPARFSPPNGVNVAMWGLNDINKLGNTTGALLPAREALKVAVARIRAGRVFEAAHSTVALAGSGTWTPAANGDASNLDLVSNPTNGGTITITTPTDFPGGTIGLCFQSGAGGSSGATISATVGGVVYSVNTIPTSLTYTTVPVYLRVPNLPEGAAAYVFTVSGASGAGCVFDYWQWEPDPDEGPWVGLVLQPKPIDYTEYGAVSPGPPTDAGVDAFNTVATEVAALFGSPRVFTIDMSVMDHDSRYWAGGTVHATAAGHRKMGELIAARLLGLGRFSCLPQTVARRVEYGTAAPTGGTRNYLQGDIVINSSPSTGNPHVWVCTVAGAPGTWRPYANL